MMNRSPRRLVLLATMGTILTLAACGGIDTTEVLAPRQPIVAGGGGGGGGEGGVITWADTISGMLATYCSECHNTGSKTGGVDVSSLEALMASGVVAPGDPDGSVIVQVLEGGIMPPAGRPGPSADEIAAVRAWIELGAP